MPEVAELIQKENVKEVLLQFTDIFGTLRSLWVSSKLFPKIADDGIHVDGSSLGGVVDVGKSDLKLLPALDTFLVLPSNLFPQKVARVVCDIYEPESSKPFEFDTRFILRKTLDVAKEDLGPSVGFYTASEVEFFLFEREEDGTIRLIDEGRYLDTPPADRAANLRLEIAETLRNMDISIEKHHHEVPHGKSEFNLAYSEALRMADTVYLVKFLVKLMAARRGLVASFMPKPFHHEYGAGLHTHLSLIDDERNQNIFSDPDGRYGLSEIALNFVAGILTHAKALAGITNPSVNSYKRLVPGWEAPVYISWARYNRSVLVRIPPGKGKETRLEYRPTDGSCNFYIAYAALLSAGLDGIRKKIRPVAPVEENIYKMSESERLKRGIGVLPANLGEGLRELSKDSYLQGSLGNAFHKKFLELKMKEWRDYSVTVHEWERKKYLDV
ncbi:MAG: glutamine synthetase family protein [Candidatus Hodarchaeota archaeon]